VDGAIDEVGPGLRDLEAVEAGVAGGRLDEAARGGAGVIADPRVPVAAEVGGVGADLALVLGAVDAAEVAVVGGAGHEHALGLGAVGVAQVLVVGVAVVALFDGAGADGLDVAVAAGGGLAGVEAGVGVAAVAVVALLGALL